MRRRLFGKLFAAALFAVLCFAVPRLAAFDWKFTRVDGRSCVSLNRIAGYYRMRLLRVGGGMIAMRGKQHDFEFTHEKKAASFNGVNLTLSFPALLKGGTLYLSRVDFETVVLPLLRRQAIEAHSVRRIVLDPGHGGKDTGARGRYYRESMLNLRLARKLKTLLEKAGFQVLLVRNADATLELATRPVFANLRRADLYLSLHMNASVDRNVSGIETYCLTPAGAASSNGGKPDARSYAGHACDANNFVLAYLIQRALVSKTGADDLGVKHARFLVLKEVNCPAVLIEHGFISNRSEERLLGSDAYLDKLAEAVARGVGNYCRAVRR